MIERNPALEPVVLTTWKRLWKDYKDHPASNIQDPADFIEDWEEYYLIPAIMNSVYVYYGIPLCTNTEVYPVLSTEQVKTLLYVEARIEEICKPLWSAYDEQYILNDLYDYKRRHNLSPSTFLMMVKDHRKPIKWTPNLD